MRHILLRHPYSIQIHLYVLVKDLYVQVWGKTDKYSNTSICFS